jgi:DNA-binding NarL/FixJ family response regulator
VATHPHRLLIVDDDDSFRSMLSELLTRAGFDARAFGRGDEALAASEDERPALVLLDVDLPGNDGYTVCSELRERFGDDLPIFFVSGKRTESYDRIGGLLIGADDYIVKPFDPDELIARVRRAVTRSSGNGVASAAAAAFELTAREQQVLGLLGGGWTQEQIADHLVISSSTVATHIQRILGKLGVHSRAQAVALAAREGLVADVSPLRSIAVGR